MHSLEFCHSGMIGILPFWYGNVHENYKLVRLGILDIHTNKLCKVWDWGILKRTFWFSLSLILLIFFEGIIHKNEFLQGLLFNLSEAKDSRWFLVISFMFCYLLSDQRHWVTSSSPLNRKRAFWWRGCRRLKQTSQGYSIWVTRISRALL